MEDLENYRIWEKRFENPGAYRKAYSGRRLASKALPRSQDMQVALKTINDAFVHPNPDYYRRHTQMSKLEAGDVLLQIHFFDDDEFYWASVLGMLHLLVVVQESVSRMFGARFVNLDVRPERFGLAQFELENTAEAFKAAGAGLTGKMIIHDIGLWPLPSVS